MKPGLLFSARAVGLPEEQQLEEGDYNGEHLPPATGQGLGSQTTNIMNKYQ